MDHRNLLYQTGPFDGQILHVKLRLSILAPFAGATYVAPAIRPGSTSRHHHVCPAGIPSISTNRSIESKCLWTD
jgi:hypothetical protein